MTLTRFTFLAVAPALFLLPGIAMSQAPSENVEVLQSKGQVKTYDFTKKRYSISATRIKFDDDFKTRGGPDLKVYLSTKTLNELDGETVDTHSMKIGVLKSKKGEQSYILPEGVSLSDYKSVIIHCEAFEVLWGGFDL